MSRPYDALTRDEALALATLLQALSRVGGSDGSEEAAALADLHERLALLPEAADQESSPYRGGAHPGEPLSRGQWERLCLVAARRPSDDSSIRGSLLAIERREAQEILFGVAYDFAAICGISAREWSILSWLEQEWELAEV